MEYRLLGRTGLKVSALALGTATFGGGNEFFKAWGQAGVDEACRMVDVALAGGVNLFDTADVYSDGLSEQILGEVLRGRRDRVLISTKATFRLGDGPNDVGSSRHHLVRSAEASLRRLGTDVIDLYHLHGFDALTAVDEVARALDDLVRAGKVRYVAASNFSGWHLMKSLALQDQRGYARFAAHQAYYSLLGRELEWELMPLGLDQGVSTLVWSPLGWGRLTGKLRRGAPAPQVSRLPATADAGPPVDDAHLFGVVDALDAVVAERGGEVTVPQVALAWLLGRPTVASAIVGARDEHQLAANLRAADLTLTPAQIARLDRASARVPASPYWHQLRFAERNPFPVDLGHDSGAPL